MEQLLAIAREYQKPWNEDLLNFIAAKLNINKMTLKLFLPYGLQDLVDFYFIKIESSINYQESHSIKTRVYQALFDLFTQLELDKDVSLRVLQAPIAYDIRMKIALRGSKKIWDSIDISSDFSYYTRIMTLSTIYARNLLVLREKGDWQNSLKEDFMKLGKIIKLKKNLSFFSS